MNVFSIRDTLWGHAWRVNYHYRKFKKEAINTLPLLFAVFWLNSIIAKIIGKFKLPVVRYQFRHR